MSYRKGFTLIELIVVIMIIAILGMVAVPRLMGARKSAQDSALVQNLAAIRNAVAMYSSEHSGALPGTTGTADAAQFKADLSGYMNSPFPSCPVGSAAGKEDDILMSTTVPFVGTTAADEGWAFNTDTGEFIINFDGATTIDPSIGYDSL